MCPLSIEQSCPVNGIPPEEGNMGGDRTFSAAWSVTAVPDYFGNMNCNCSRMLQSPVMSGFSML
jgi:hypothetical protein